MLDRSLIALGRHSIAFDRVYWAYTLSGMAVGVVLGLVTGLWGLCGFTLAAFAVVAILARLRFEKSQGG
ncbi:MAG TPA: hypothetical protein VH268_07425 [Solirubrobacterales bacterium]|nr:hypothetical protein [Solirubrobacterales bacterium]